MLLGLFLMFLHLDHRLKPLYKTPIFEQLICLWDWSLVMGRGRLQYSRGEFYSYKNGGGEKVLAMLKREGHGGVWASFNSGVLAILKEFSPFKRGDAREV